VGQVNGNALTLVNTIVRSMRVAKLKIASAALAVLFVLAIGLNAILPSVSAQRNPGGEAAPIVPKKAKPIALPDCVLQAVDLANRRIEAIGADVDGEGGSLIYELIVPPEAIIRIEGREARLDQLQVGSSLHLEALRQLDGRITAIRIDAGPVPVEGIVQAFDEKTVTILPDKQAEAKTFDLDKATWLVLYGKKAKLSDLKVKMKVAVNVSVKKPAVFAIQAVGAKTTGVLKAIEIERRTLSLGDERFVIAPDALIIINGRAGRFDDLRAGMQVTLQHAADTDRKEITSITAK
jgi:hypothetical protein